MLHISDFSKSFGSFTVLSIKHLILKSGIYWIQGENGSGKTSLFKSIAGILPFQGEIRCNETTLRGSPVDYRMLVNYSEAEPLYPGFLTAADLIRFIGTAKKSTRAQQEEIKSTFGIDLFACQACSTYSSGMLKKVSLAAAFLGTPSVIILDEPFITIDSNTREILHRKIEELVHREVTFLISSHQSLEEITHLTVGTYTIQNKTLVAS